jgi:ribonucleotide reductase alpha subunit
MSKRAILSKNSQVIFDQRYSKDGEDWQQCIDRVSDIASSRETTDRDRIKSDFADMIYNQYFLPGGRIFRNAGRPRGSLFNCYHLPIGDSIDEIGDCIRDSLVLWSEGGGVGINFSPLRPEGDEILGKGGASSGLVSFMTAFDACADTIESGGSRRAAAIAHIDVSHPELFKFIDAKTLEFYKEMKEYLDPKIFEERPDLVEILRERLASDLRHFNISVAINNDFIKAVETDSDWTFKFKHKTYNTLKAKEIWHKIIHNMVHYAEPGLLNWTNFAKNNSYYFEPVLGTNPCLTGDTLVAVADGRNYVPIKQLAEEGKDVPVYSLNENTKKTEVKIMRNPRITGVGKKIFKITLDDGSSFRCTGNHKIYMKDGTIKEASELQPNDRLNHMVKYRASIEEIFKKSNSISQDYFMLNNGFRSNVFEHRLIAEHKIGRKLVKGEVVHHSDRNGLNNAEDNLEVMLKKQHDRLHGDLMKGENNPMNRFPEKNWLIKQDWAGENNGRYKGYNGQDLFNIAVGYSKKYERRLTRKEWDDICRKDGLPVDQVGVNQTDYIKCTNDLLKYAAIEANVFVYESSAEIRYYKEFLKIKEETDLDVFYDKGTFVNKKCEGCGESFITPWGLRERCFCSIMCSNKYKDNNYGSFEEKQKKTREEQIKIFNALKFELKREPWKKEWENECRKNNIPIRFHKGNKYSFSGYKELKNVVDGRNYKVVSVEIDGYETVYNGTVDDNHNFYIMVNETKTKSKKTKYNHILTRQCGETTLGPYGVCNLGSLVLPNFIPEGGTNTNWKKLEQTVKTAVRFLDNIIDVNRYTLKEIDASAHRSRRVGIGVLGLAEYLFAKKARYGSEESVRHVEYLMYKIRNYAYQASIELAAEKGSFPSFDPIPYSRASFVSKLKPWMRRDIKKYGIRNCTLMALAPTGTISLLTPYMSGIEPLFAKAYLRSDRVGERYYIHPMYEKFLEADEPIPDWFVTSDEITPSDHFEVQVACQKYCDGAVSKTINMPKGTTEEQLSELLLEYIYDVKGTTVYVDGSREGQILNKIDESELKKQLSLNKVERHMNETDVQCASGSCEI